MFLLRVFLLFTLFFLWSECYVVDFYARGMKKKSAVEFHIIHAMIPEFCNANVLSKRTNLMRL